LILIFFAITGQIVFIIFIKKYIIYYKERFYLRSLSHENGRMCEKDMDVIVSSKSKKWYKLEYGNQNLQLLANQGE
jgi:hypothetical protein